MEEITPSLVVSATDMLNGTKCDGIELTKNLFKDHKMSIDGSKKQRLETYLRIRSLPDVEPNDRKYCYQEIDSKTLLVIPPKGSNANKFNSESERKKFIFSKIFDERCDQSMVYDSCALPIVKRVLSGQNGLLFAYGITSSGKSYTMRGTTSNPGVIPRALRTVFEVVNNKIVREVPQLKPNTFTECSMLSAEEREFEEEVRTFIFKENDESYEMRRKMSSFRSQISVINENSDESLLWDDVLHSTFRKDDSNLKCCVWISFYEIYNETVYDLLELEVIGERKQKILLLKDESNNYYVKGLRQIFVTSPEEAYKVLLFGQNNLHISSTNLNKNSSRSHCAFNITVVSTFNNSYSKRSAINMNHLSICDLAGAERSEKANNIGDRIREAGKINGSLLSLSRCISSLRHNQKFEHDASKQRFVNYRDSKLTKVFQPFLSGNGVAAMISTMNPSPNLFDETFFALKFTGVASQVIVSSEDQRNKFHDSLKRLTQMWMQSSERWSNFASLKPPKPSVSIIQTIKEEDEESDDNESLDMTVDEIEKKVGEMTQMDLSRADPQEIEVLRTQIEFLVEKLKQTENDKFEMEVEVRKQVVSEFNKLFKDMQDMADDKDRAKKELEDMMAQRLITTERYHKQEKLELETKLNSMETENFKINEELCQLREDRETVRQALTEAQRINEQKDQTIRQLESQIEEYSVKKLENESQNLKDVFTSPIKYDIKNSGTSPLRLNLIDANTSALNLLESKDVNTSAIGFDSQLISSNIEFTDIGVGNSFTEPKDSETSTTNLNEMIDKNTSISIVSSNKSTFTQKECFNCFEDKQTETELWSPSETTLVDRSVPMSNSKDISTSPIVFITSTSETTSSICLATKEYNELMEKLRKYENELKENKAMVRYHQTLEIDSIKKYQDLEDEKNKLEERLKSKEGQSGFNLDFFKALKQSKTGSTVDSVASSSVSSFGSKAEETNSMTSLDSAQEKPKKSLKYSSRKRKPVENSSDKRYLSSVDEPLEGSQGSVNSDSCYADEVGNEVYSNKKKSNREKRKVNRSNENEELNKGPQSKRKRPALKSLYSSPISPIPGEKRITRSKAKKCLQSFYNI